MKKTTKAGYNTVINHLKKDDFGSKRIDKVKQLDAKTWLIKLQQKDKKSYSSIHSIRGVLRPAFQLAVDDDLIRKNPFDFPLVDVVLNDSARREALTREEERNFLRFVKEDKHFSRYYNGVFILLKTGLRISELVGLAVNDVDFKNHSITIDHQLHKRGKKGYYIERGAKTLSGNRVIPMEKPVEECFLSIIKNRNDPEVEPVVDGYSGFLFFDKNGSIMYALHQLQKGKDENGKYDYYIEDTKSKKGERSLPMSPEVEECFRTIIKKRKPPKIEPSVDGKSGFLYFDKNGNIAHALHWEHYFKNILEKYNSIYKVELPTITPHVCRHTYCTKMAKKRVSPKALQYLMGHAEIGITLDVYTTLTDIDVEEELREIEARDVGVETGDDYKSDIIKFDDRRQKVD